MYTFVLIYPSLVNVVYGMDTPNQPMSTIQLPEINLFTPLVILYQIVLGPLHLSGFENRMADLPFYYRRVPSQLERQGTAYLLFCLKRMRNQSFLKPP